MPGGLLALALQNHLTAGVALVDEQCATGFASACLLSACSFRLEGVWRFLFRSAELNGRRRYALISVFAGFAAPVHAIVRRVAWRAATRRKRYDLVPTLALAIADIRRDTMYVVIEFRGETPLDCEDFIVWIRNHLRLP